MSDNTPSQFSVSPELVLDVLHTPSILRLSLRSPGYMNVNGCSLVVFTLFCNFVLAMLAIVSRKSVSREASDFFSPSGNHFGFLWLVSTVVTFLGLPIFLTYILKPVRQVTFDKTRNELLSGNKRLCALTLLHQRSRFFLAVRATSPVASPAVSISKPFRCSRPR